MAAECVEICHKERRKGSGKVQQRDGGENQIKKILKK
jgi:hypothetical protein